MAGGNLAELIEHPRYKRPNVTGPDLPPSNIQSSNWEDVIAEYVATVRRDREEQTAVELERLERTLKRVSLPPSGTHSDGTSQAITPTEVPGTQSTAVVELSLAVSTIALGYALYLVKVVVFHTAWFATVMLIGAFAASFLWREGHGESRATIARLAFKLAALLLAVEWLSAFSLLLRH